jgi:hypothetical protein
MRYDGGLGDNPGLFPAPGRSSSATAEPVVTVIRAVPRAPKTGESRFKAALTRALRVTRLVLALIFAILLVGTYPVLTVMSHRIDHAPVMLTAGEDSSGVLERVRVLMAREADGPGWAADRPVWHPAARLSAMPAWQETLAEALSDVLVLEAGMSAVNAEPDRDLMMASRLMRVRDDGSMEARLLGAKEALTRHAAREAEGGATKAGTPERLDAHLEMIGAWAGLSGVALASASADADSLLARREAIAAFTAARARAQVARTVLAGLREDGARDGSLSAERLAVLDAVIASWGRVAEASPLLIVNGRVGTFPGSDLLGLGYLNTLAADATLAARASAAVSSVETEGPKGAAPR